MKLLVLVFLINILKTQAAVRFQDDYACFISILDITCKEGEMLVFERARYGRNDSSVAQRCSTPYHKNCDIDVTLTLNRNCGGKNKCQLHVNDRLFGDPCGYEEFLIVLYQCVQNAMVSNECPDTKGPPLFDHGYLSSPNYPDKYYRDAQCSWQLSVQKHQTIRVTLFDFELDVRRNGRCNDYLEISAGDRVYFKDCGAQGRQQIDIDAQNAIVRFNTDTSSLTERGFFVYFEGVGPGCHDLDDIRLGSVEYYMLESVLYANVTCDYGYVIPGTDVDFLHLQCKGYAWSQPVVTACVAVPPLTSPGPLPSITIRGETVHDPTSTAIETLCLVLGIISALLLLSLLLILVLYYRKSKQRQRGEKYQFPVIENELNVYRDHRDPTWKACSADYSDEDVCVHMPRSSAKLNNTSACKPFLYSDDDGTLDYSEVHDTTAPKCMMLYDVPPQPRVASLRKNSRSSINKAAMTRKGSGARILEAEEDPNKTLCSECGNRTPKTSKRRPQSQKDLRTKRTRSGQWVHNRSAAQTPSGPPEVPVYGFPTYATQSAPDLTNMDKEEETRCDWAIAADQPYTIHGGHMPSSVQSTPYHNTTMPDMDNKRATIGATPSARQKLQYLMKEDNI